MDCRVKRGNDAGRSAPGSGFYFSLEIARNEANTGIVGDHQVARGNSHLADLNGTIDLYGLQPPLAGDGSDVARPDGIADGAGMGDVAHPALDDRPDLSLALAGLGRDAAHVGDVG